MQHERTYWGSRLRTKQWRGRGRVGMMQEKQEHHQSNQSMASSSQEQPVGWVNQQAGGKRAVYEIELRYSNGDKL